LILENQATTAPEAPIVVMLVSRVSRSPFNPMQRKERQGLLLVYPAIIFIYWVMFQVRLMSLDPHVHHHLGLTGFIVDD